MSRMFERLFAHLPPITAPAELIPAVLARIAREAARQARRLLWTGIALAAIAVAAGVPATRYVISEMSRSGFWQYVHLLFTDSGAALAQWQDYALSLMETAPLLAFAAVAAILFVILEAVRRITASRASHRFIVSH